MADARPDIAVRGPGHHSPVALALLVAGCFFMEMLDGTIVTTAAPRIGADLGIGAASISLVVVAYLMALAIFIPMGGWLMTLVPARGLFAGAVALFTLASLGCGLAENLTVLTLFRVAQGVGGALMVPVGRQLVLRDTPKEDVIRMMSYIVWPGLLAPVIAPVVGGAIVTWTSWHWLFWINVPLGLVAIGFALRLVPRHVEGPRTRFDALGFVLVALGLGGLTWGTHMVADRVGSTWGGVLVCVLAFGFCWTASAYLFRASTPLVQLSVLRDRVFGLSQLGALAFWIGVAAVPFLIPLQLQTTLGWSPLAAGVLVTFVFIGNVGIKPATTPMLRRFGFRAVLVVNTTGLAVTAALFGWIAPHAPSAVLALVALVSGVCRSCVLTAFGVIGFGTIPLDQRRAANTLQAVTSQMGSGLGIAGAAVALRVGAFVGSGSIAFGWAFTIVAIVSVVAVVVAVGIPRTAGHELRA